MQSPKYSVVIPTYNHCEKYLKPCIDSIIKYTEMADIESVSYTHLTLPTNREV